MLIDQSSQSKANPNRGVGRGGRQMSVGVRDKENIITNFVNPYNTVRLLFFACFLPISKPQ